MVLFHVPSPDGHIELGFVLSVWKGIKAPKLHHEEVPIESCPAFRVLQLDLKDEDPDLSADWVASKTSTAYVVRMESLVAILDVESCASASQLTD